MCSIIYEEAKNFALIVEAENDQRSAEMKSVTAMKNLDRYYQSKSGVVNNNVLDDDYNMIYNVMNAYFGDNKNQECEINEECYNKPNDIGYSNSIINKAETIENKEDLEGEVEKEMNSANNMNKASRCYYKSIEAKINNEIKMAKPKELIDATWKSKVDNINKDVKIIESGTKTLDIGDCEATVKSDLVFVEKMILFIAILMFVVIIEPNVNSYAGLGCNQK
ncbi:13358_t:CDS:2, partial [Dentiscutata erythropus]